MSTRWADDDSDDWFGGYDRLPVLAAELTPDLLNKLTTQPATVVHPMNRPMLIATLAYALLAAEGDQT